MTKGEDGIIYDFRYVARYVIECSSPLAVGSGEKDELTDARVIRDVNQLPYIPASSLAGVLRHATGNNDKVSTIWGFQENNKGRGSLISFTNANIVDGDGQVTDGILSTQSEFLKRYLILPIRQHAAINEFGTTLKGGKFDEEVVYAGTRFCFEMEIMFTSDMKEQVEEAVNDIHESMARPTLRLGGGTRCGFGDFDIVSLRERWIDLNDERQLTEYLAKSSSLAEDGFWKQGDDSPIIVQQNDEFVTYQLNLKPDSFFFFGSGMGDEDVDATPAKESVVKWTEGKGRFQDGNILIPATSVKGAITHRVAYHYNRIKGVFADQDVHIEEHVMENNDAVRRLFGLVSKEQGGKAEAGRVFISDVIKDASPEINEKTFTHVSIDPFTGGGREKTGALYNEKVIDAPNLDISLTISVLADALRDHEIEDAFTATLDDIVNGRLALGGGVNRGNGIFEGVYKKVEAS